MATSAMVPPQNSAAAPTFHSSASVKVLSESPHLNSIPSNYIHSSSSEESPDASHAEDSSLIPIIDFSQLTSNHSDQRSKAIQVLDKACEEWGFFMVVNHDIPESLIKAVIDVTNEFFNMPEEDKKQFEGKHLLDPIRCGTSFNSSKEKALFWRDFLKVFVHPEFHCPSHPQAFSEVMSEYCENSRKVAKKLLGAISESLGIDECALNNALALDSMFQIFIGNYYPRCPQPELAMGLPPHSDHGLLTLLIQNGVGGLQIMHKEKWVDVNAVPNSLLVNTGDHLEIASLRGRSKPILKISGSFVQMGRKKKNKRLFLLTGQSLTGIAGSPAYVAPEVLLGHYTEKVDIWSAGVTLYALLCGLLPFHGNSLESVFNAIKKENLTFCGEVWKSVSQPARDLISRMLTRDASARYSADEVLRHPWILFFTEPTLNTLISKPRIRNHVRLTRNQLIAVCGSESERNNLTTTNHSFNDDSVSTPSSGKLLEGEESSLVDVLAMAISRVKISEPKRSRLCSPARQIEQECTSNIKVNHLCTAF